MSRAEYPLGTRKLDTNKVRLTRAESAQVQRILAERIVISRYEHQYDEHEAVEIVICDRPVKELVCHGGTVESL